MSSSALSTTATSPLELLPVAELTGSGLLRLDTADGEVELLQCQDDRLELRSESAEPLSSHPSYRQRVGLDKTVLTTHRLVCFSGKQARFLHLSNIHAIDYVSTSVFSQHSKIRLSTYSLGDLIVVVSKKESSLLPALNKSLERRAWESASRLQQAKQLTSVSKRRVGVDAILAQNKRKHERASQVTEKAFEGDAETLLREATELVAIIQKYAATLEQSSGEKEKQDTTQLADMLQDMGMTSALAAKGSSDYYEVLARQLTDFIVPKLQQHGGMMTLTDLYCLYNRARASNLISPHDLYMAVSCLERLGLQIRLREFPSGVKVVEFANVDQEKVSRKLETMANEGVTAIEVSRQLKMSALLAQEALLEAERSGHLCRDVTLETTRFYPNRFDEFAKLKW